MGKRETAKDAFSRNLAELSDHIEDLSELLAEMLEKAEAAKWGDVGDIAHYNGLLAQVTDAHFKRGEYAD